MQAAKDSFYMALRDRLAAADPGRTILVDGAARPAIVVRENMEPQFTECVPGAFYLDWGEARAAASAQPIMAIECRISYCSVGASDTGADRGRRLGEMDEMLLKICEPPHTRMRDYSQAPSADMGAGVFWTMPEIENAARDTKLETGSAPSRLERQARMNVYFFPPEVES
jgi:hypothetical protein